MGRTELHSALNVVLHAGLILALGACSATPEGGSSVSPTTPSSAGNNATAGAGPVTPLGGSGGMGLNLGDMPQMVEMGGAGGMDPAHQATTTLPPGFTATEIGGFKLGDPVVDGNGGSGGMSGGGGGGGAAGGSSMGDCGNILLGVVRDFKGASEGGNPDFEANGIQGADITPGMVQALLGTDQKPQYSSMCEVGHPGPKAVCPFGAQNTSKDAFDQWYHDVPGVNMPYLVSIWLAPRPGGLFTFQSLSYFPIDNAGFMDARLKADDGKLHNFSFTTELHTHFLYRGGEVFNFQGDDDVWVFINNKLAVDLGGLHPMQQRSVNLDTTATTLGITKGTIYALDLFHAERHTTSSTFRIDTNLSFTDCGTVIPSKVK